ncbi:MAG: trypsin-like peptidase domain-containing protein [candidate division WOR-3 bacterium]
MKKVLFLLLIACNSKGYSSENDDKFLLNRIIDSTRATAIVYASQIASSSVVSITVLTKQVVEEYPPFLDPFWREIIPPSYSIRTIQSLGSGVVITPDGYVITNEHVIGEKPESILVTFPNSEQYSAKLIYKDSKLDLALLKIKSDKKNFPFAKLGNSDSLMVGEWVVAIGNPLAFYLENTEPTITAGIISAIGRSVKGKEDREYKNMIQTDAAINPGNSGGALVNIRGEVIGINTFIFSQSGGFEGIGFAIPINTVKKFFNEVIKYGKIREAYIGIEIQPLNEELKKALKYNGFGLLVSNSMEPNIKEGDIIVEVNGKQIRNVGDWHNLTYFLLPEEKLKLKVFRNGKFYDVEVVSKEFKYDEFKSDFGIRYTINNSIIAQKFRLKTSKGIVVLDVISSSMADYIGINKGDVILSMNRIEIRNESDFNRAFEIVKKNRYIEIIIDRFGQKLFLRSYI